MLLACFMPKIIVTVKKIHKKLLQPELLFLVHISTKSFGGSRPTGGAYSAPPDPLTVFRELTSNGRKGKLCFHMFRRLYKTFDRVNYWKLFNKLLDDGTNSSVIAVLAYWYSHQQVCVRWHNSSSTMFHTGNGIRQGGVLSPTLFSRYIRDLLAEIANLHVGCNIGGLFINVLAYADDIVLLTPSWYALQKLLIVLEEHIGNIDMVCNTKKTVCIMLAPRDKAKVMNVTFAQFKLGGCLLQYVQVFKYLGHMITNTQCDNDDVHREIRNLFIRTNILAHHFAKCSVDVKVTLFKAYCISLYDAGLWSKYKMTTLNELSSCYNKCLKVFLAIKVETV